MNENLYEERMADAQSTLLYLPTPQSLFSLPKAFALDAAQYAALYKVRTLPLGAPAAQTLQTLERALAELERSIVLEDTAVQRAQKFDIYDEFFKIGRCEQCVGPLFLHGLLLSYANVLSNMEQDSHTMSVIELPLLRLAVDSILGLIEEAS